MTTSLGPVDDREQYLRYRHDRAVLAAIGARLESQVSRVAVRLPRPLAESAVAAWDREESSRVGEESREEYELRDDAAELAWIGLAISERGVWDGEETLVDRRPGRRGVTGRGLVQAAAASDRAFSHCERGPRPMGCS